MPFLSIRCPADAPRTASPARRQVHKGRTDAQYSEQTANMRLPGHHAANPGRTGPWPERRRPVAGGGRAQTTPDRPATACRPDVLAASARALSPSGPPSRGRTADAFAACRERSISPCGKRCRPRWVAGWSETAVFSRVHAKNSGHGANKEIVSSWWLPCGTGRRECCRPRFQGAACSGRRSVPWAA